MLETFLYNRSWDSITGNWILSKFNLKDRNSVYTISENEITMNVKSIDLDFNPSKFENLQLLVFNTGVTDPNIFDLELKLQQDGEELIKLITGISLNTNISASILIVYWESSETILDNGTISKYLKLNRIAKNFSSVISDIIVTNLVDVSPHETLELGLKQVSSSYKFNYTERGKYNLSLQRKRSLAGIYSQDNSTLNITKRIDEKMRKMLDSERKKHEASINERNTYSHLQNHLIASPKAKKMKLPVLLSEVKNKNFKLRTPSAPSMDTAASSPRISSHLAMKYRKTQRIVSVPDVIAPGTPSYSRNFPSNSQLSNSSTLALGNRTPTITNIGPLSTNDPQQPQRQQWSTPVTTTTHHKYISPHQYPPSTRDSSDIPSNIRELKSLIDSVKKNLNKN
ncbi:hypothetical protein Kpol_1036p78, partial [Vanderwaltozyma polyspora DSM 70294]